MSLAKGTQGWQCARWKTPDPVRYTAGERHGYTIRMPKEYYRYSHLLFRET